MEEGMEKKGKVVGGGHVNRRRRDHSHSTVTAQPKQQPWIDISSLCIIAVGYCSITPPGTGTTHQPQQQERSCPRAPLTRKAPAVTPPLTHGPWGHARHDTRHAVRRWCPHDRPRSARWHVMTWRHRPSRHRHWRLAGTRVRCGEGENRGRGWCARALEGRGSSGCGSNCRWGHGDAHQGLMHAWRHTWGRHA